MLPFMSTYLVNYLKELRWIPLLVGFLLCSFSAKKEHKPSTSTSPKAIQYYQKATQAYLATQHQQAISLYQEAIKKDKRFIEAYLKLAHIYKSLEQFKAAEKLLNQARPYLAFHPAYFYYKVAHLYYRIGAYKKAHLAFQKIPLTTLKDNILLAKITTLQKNLTFAIEQIQHPVSFTPQLLPPPINQFTSQYFPMLTLDQKTILFTAPMQKEGRFTENIYISHQDEQGQWSTPTSISDQINDTASHEGACTLSADKQTIIFTSCARKGNYGVCDLYVSHKKGDQWSKPKNLGAQVNSKQWQSQPSLSVDGKTLYFVAERAGNYGKKDIWQSRLQPDGNWSKATNLGPIVNSTAQETAPFIHPNGTTLFFTSNRAPSMGGFDIYYTNLVNGAWTTPINLGYPINNHKDQASIYVTADGKKGYYADGKRKDQTYNQSYLYAFDMPAHLLPILQRQVITLQVRDAKNNQPTEAQIQIYDPTTGDCLHEEHINDPTGTATVVVPVQKAYQIYILKEGHLFENLTYDATTASKQAPIILHPVEVGQVQILKNIYFNYDCHTLDSKSYLELNHLVQFLQGHPQLSITLEGHTDHVGSATYNDQLSTKRAQSVFNYLVQAGINSQRLAYQGYGKKHPIAPNDSPQHRQLNRRVAFRVHEVKHVVLPEVTGEYP
eukprot:gene754-934_t